MGRNSKGINLTFIIIMILIAVTIWLSFTKEREESYTKGELVTQLEKGEVVGAEIQPNTQVPTGIVYITLRNIQQPNKLYVSDVQDIQ